MKKKKKKEEEEEEKATFKITEAFRAKKSEENAFQTISSHSEIKKRIKKVAVFEEKKDR